MSLPARFGYLVSSFFGRFSVGASGCVAGADRGDAGVDHRAAHTAGMQMLRSQLIRWLIYIAVMGFYFSGNR
jgi:hypothetical protein